MQNWGIMSKHENTHLKSAQRLFFLTVYTKRKDSLSSTEQKPNSQFGVSPGMLKNTDDCGDEILVDQQSFLVHQSLRVTFQPQQTHKLLKNGHREEKQVSRGCLCQKRIKCWRLQMKWIKIKAEYPERTTNALKNRLLFPTSCLCGFFSNEQNEILEQTGHKRCTLGVIVPNYPQTGRSRFCAIDDNDVIGRIVLFTHIHLPRA